MPSERTPSERTPIEHHRHLGVPDAARAGAGPDQERDRPPPPGASREPRGRAGRGRWPRQRQPPRRHGDGDLRPRARRGARGGRAAHAGAGRARARADRGRHVRDVRAVRQADRGGPSPRAPVGHTLHRRPATRRPGVVRVVEPGPAHDADDRVIGARTNGLAPVSVAERSLAAGPWQWLGLAAVVVAAAAADQLTKHVVSTELALDEDVHVLGPFSIHHVQNSGIAFGLFASATAVVTLLTAVAVAWMLVFFGRSGSRHPVLPAALGLLIGGILLLALVVSDRAAKSPPRRPLDVAAR